MPLDSWNDGAAKSAIVDFVARVTAEGGTDFVSPAERIAVFDNDGTLWCEQPMPMQGFFLADRVKQFDANMRFQESDGATDGSGRPLEQPSGAGQAAFIQGGDEHLHRIDAVHSASYQLLRKSEE